MKPFTSELFIFRLKLGHKMWICVPFGGVYLVPGVPEQVAHQEQKHHDTPC